MSSPEFEQFERIAEAQERQADALELIAGMLMVYYCYDPDQPDYTVEALEKEARFHAAGGDRL